MAEIANLKIGIGASTEQFSSGLADVKTQLGGLGDMASSAMALLSNPIALATAAIVGIGAAAFKVGSDFDAAFDNIRIGTGATGENLEALKEDFRGVFGTVPDDTATVGAAIADLNTRLGLTGQPLEDMTRQFLDLARITGGDVSTQIANVTRVFGDWGIATEDQSGSMDFLFKTAQTTGIGVDKLSNTIVQFGAPLRQLGFDFESSAVLIGKWEKEGVNVETVLAGMKMGLSNFAEAGIPAEQALQGVIDEIQALGPGADATGVAMEVFGKRAGPDMAAAILEGRFELDEIMATIQASPETIGTAAEDVKDFGERWGELTNKVSLLLEPLGTFLFDALGSVATLLVDSFNPAMEFMGELWDGLMTFLQPVIDAFKNNVLPVLQDVGTVWVGLQLMLADLFIPVIGAVWDALKPLVSFIADHVVAQVKLFWQGIETLIGWLKQIPGVSDLFTAAQERVTKAMGGTAEEQQRAALAAQFLGTEQAKAAEEADKLAKLQEVSRAKAKEQTEQISALNTETRLLSEMLGKATEAEKKSIQAQIDANNKKVEAILNADLYGKSLGDLTKATDKTTPSIKNLSQALRDGKKAKDDTSTSADRLKVALKELEAQEKENEKIAKEAAKTQKAFEDATSKVWQAMDKETAAATATHAAVSQVLSITNAVTLEVDEMAEKTLLAEQALRDMGIKPQGDLQALADKAAFNFQVIQDSGVASAHEVELAWINMMQNRENALKAQGLTLPAEEQKTLDALLEKHESFGIESTGIFSTWAKDVKGVTDLLATDMLKGLFTGDLSFGGNFKQHLTTLKDSFINTLTGPMMDALTGPNGFVTKGINALMGALDGVIAKVTGGVGGAFANVFGSSIPGVGGGSGGPSVPGVPGLPGGGGSGGAPGGGAAGGGGALGIINAVTGIGTLISGIFGNFQAAQTNAYLDLIEKEARKIKNILGGDGQNEGISLKLSDIQEGVWFGPGVKAVERHRNEWFDFGLPVFRALELQGQYTQPTLDHFGDAYFSQWGPQFSQIIANTADTARAVRELQGNQARQGMQIQDLQTAIERNEGGITTTLERSVGRRR